jgi:GNS1/SUR4 family
VFANSIVHFIMYGYYNLSIFKVNFLPKVLVTLVQLIQFVSMMVQGTLVALRPDCPFPRRIAVTYVVYIFTLFALFLEFFLRNYVFSSKPAAAKPKTQ